MITANETVTNMVNSIRYRARDKGLSLKGITSKNFNTFLDDLFQDGGEARCVWFIDLADEYALQFGDFESSEYDKKRFAVIDRALRILENHQYK